MTESIEAGESSLKMGRPIGSGVEEECNEEEEMEEEDDDDDDDS